MQVLSRALLLGSSPISGVLFGIGSMLTLCKFPWNLVNLFYLIILLRSWFFFFSSLFPVCRGDGFNYLLNGILYIADSGDVCC